MRCNLVVYSYILYLELLHVMIHVYTVIIITMVNSPFPDKAGLIVYSRDSRDTSFN